MSRYALSRTRLAAASARGIIEMGRDEGAAIIGPRQLLRKNKKSRFTPQQTKVLRLLGDACATGRDTGKTLLSPNAAIYLNDGFFTCKRTVKLDTGGQRTIYWLTERGVRAYLALISDGPSCRHCGCSFTNACKTPHGPCAWASPALLDPPGNSYCTAPACLAAEAARLKAESAAV